MEGSARGSHRGDEQAQPGSSLVPAPQAPSCRKQPGIPAPPRDLLLWNNSTEDGTSWERRPWVCVLPLPRSLQQGSLRALPSPRELVFHLSKRALGLFLGFWGMSASGEGGTAQVWLSQPCSSAVGQGDAALASCGCAHIWRGAAGCQQTLQDSQAEGSVEAPMDRGHTSAAIPVIQSPRDMQRDL